LSLLYFDICFLDVSTFNLDPAGEVFIALGRVFSGVLRRNSKIFVLGHRHNPSAEFLSSSDLEGDCPSGMASAKCVPSNSFGMYMCLGPSYFAIDEAYAGNIVGIVGLDDLVLKTATLASTWACSPMNAITFQAKPMVRVALEPLSHRDLQKLEVGLQLLYQYDPVVEVGVDDSGQHTMTCLGELHLELCLKNLIERFAK